MAGIERGSAPRVATGAADIEGNRVGTLMDEGDTPVDRNRVQSVVRACDILASFSATRPVQSLQELSTATGLSRTTVHRLASTLRSTGFLVLEDHGRYRLGTRLFQLGSIVAGGMDLRRAARDVMEALATDTGDTVFLLVIEDDDAMCVERIHGETAFTLNLMPVGGTLPLHVSAGATVLLAHHEAELLPRILATGPTVYTDATVVDAGELRDRSARIRDRGYSYADGDVVPGIAGFGAPVFGGSGEVVAALSVGGLAHRFEAERGELVLRALRAAALALSERLGYEAS